MEQDYPISLASDIFDDAAASRTPMIFVVDDDVSIRESIEGLLINEGWRTVTFSSASAFLEYSRDDGANCLVLDVKLPGLNGLELQQRLTADGFPMPIVFVTGYGDVPMAVQAMRAGAVDVLTKPFESDILVNAVRRALKISSAARQDVAQIEALRKCYATLSPRERQVMEGVATGHLNKTVGAKLGISEITVKAHRGRVMSKMKARSLADLVNMRSMLQANQTGQV